MNKPNKLLKKKYISSLVIAAFLILSVLTAYNIRMGNERPEDTDQDVQETIGQSEDVVHPGDNEEDNSSAAENGAEETMENEREDGGEDAGQSPNGTRQEKQQDTGKIREDAEKETQEKTEKNYDYDGKKKLTWPVVGNVILPYSMDTTVYYTTLDQYACNDGILISSKKGEKVVAAADGRVVNIAETDRYGTTMTVLIGKYYEVNYSQLDNVKCEIGDEVEEGEVIATVADPARSFILEGPHLFFKMTYKGKPVNPTDYLQ